MILEDLLAQSWKSVWGHRLRSGLTMLGITIGISSVILLTSIGEGTRLYILREFTQFGTNLVSINPGKMETTGMPGSMGGTIHPLNLDEAEALQHIPGVERTVPVCMGAADVAYAGKSRGVIVYGATSDGTEVWKMNVRGGSFLPPSDMHMGSPLAVLGPRLKRELFGEENALGQHVRIGGERFLVIGIMEPKGQFLGFDLDDAAYVPVSVAMNLFNRQDLQEIDLLLGNASTVDSTVARLRRTLIQRHGGTEDFTITTQTSMLETLDRIISIISLAVVGIGAISLLVGAIGILTMMWISVNERTEEIGLAKAIGATRGQILWLFLGEAVLLSTAGGLLGLLSGIGVARLIHAVLPGLPVRTPVVYAVLAVATSFLVGILSGILPARRAARMDPVVALAAE
jgi:putative ABC transport system permease protein